jgi:hypothetical protein
MCAYNRTTIVFGIRMSIGTEQSTKQERQAGRGLIVAAIVCVVASGGLLWWRYGGSIFNDMVLAGLAWCF